jgi:hypothetical protein
MSILLMVNVGNSDLLADGERPKMARPDGERLWQHYEQHTFTLPIIVPCLENLQQRHTHIERLLLFDTDQQPYGVALEKDRYGVVLRDKDTIWFGKLIERYLREHFAHLLGSITRIDLSDINPSMYDEAFDAYGKLLAQQYDPGVEMCYVLMAGGIPACNTALQLQAISCYGARCEPIYQPEGGKPYPLRVGQQVQNTFRKATIIDALERQDFATAHALAVQSDTGDTTALLRLIAYAHYREAFDFERAREALQQAQRAASGKLRMVVTELEHEMDDLVAREDMAVLLRELLANARITFTNGRYADFLGRVFRFQEAALRYIVETKMELPTDMSKQKRAVNGPLFQQGINENASLKMFLDGRTIDNKPLRYDIPTIPVMQALLDYLIQGGTRVDGTPYLSKPEQGRYTGVKKQLDRFNSLAQLRNQSIIAHGFQGVSQDRLAEEYQGDPIKDLQGIVENVLGGGKLPESPFERIAQVAIEYLRRGG